MLYSFARVGAVVRLRVRDYGVSNFNASQLRRAQAIAPVETLQPPYSLIDRRIEVEILPVAEREGIGMIVYRRWPPACSPAR